VKGETVLDTIYTLQAMMVDVFVSAIRSPPAASSPPRPAARQRAERGEAHVSHPTQGLLDVLTSGSARATCRTSASRSW